jgi:uncharacterized membrane protein HdeD (DUF308 family)
MNSGTEKVIGGVVVAANAPAVSAAQRLVTHELQHLRSSWCWFLLLGILLVVCGTMAMLFPVFGTVVAIAALSVILMVAGVATIVSAFWAGKWSGFLVHLLVGILYVAAGFVVSDRPLVAVETITVFIAMAFIVVGVFRTLAALVIRFPQWGWALLNGVVTLLVGIAIYRQLPLSVFWVIGLLVGVEMLLNGWTWIMLSRELRRIPKEASQ